MEKTKDAEVIYSIIIAIILLLLFSAVSVNFLKQFFLNPIKKINEEIGKLGKGLFDINLEEKGPAEIKELSLAFNYLARELKSYTENLKKETAGRQAFETEIEIAGKMQKTILPQEKNLVNKNEYELDFRLIPAKIVSGDFYDFFMIDDDRVALLIADVSGKGLQAAFFMAMSKIVIKNICLTLHSDPAMTLQLANESLTRDNDICMFVTVFLSYYNIKTGELVSANAGHPEAVLVKKNREYSYFCPTNGAPLGYNTSSIYKNHTILIEKGDMLMLYTDGVIEAQSPSQECYGEERMKDILLKNAVRPLSEINNALIRSVTEYEEGNQSDDITLLTLRRLNPKL